MPLIDNKVADDFKIFKSLKTINYLIEQKAKIVIISHLARPRGKITESYSLKIVLPSLEKLLNQKVKFFNQYTEDLSEGIFSDLEKTEVLLLENLRFSLEEEDGEENFVKNLASFADIYVNDAFSCSHRDHASMTKIVKFLPSYMGFLLSEEIVSLKSLFETSVSPKLAIMGGSKISTKIGLISSLIEKIDSLVIGGSMANNFLLVKGKNIGKSSFEEKYLKEAENIINLATKLNVDLILPEDVMVKSANSDPKIQKMIDIEEVGPEDIIMDVGSKTCNHILSYLNQSRLVIWNGPLGKFEEPPFDYSTKILSKNIARRSREAKLISIVGGGDTSFAISSNKLSEDFTYISTGGGAFLEFLEGKNLPAIEALERCPHP